MAVIGTDQVTIVDLTDGYSVFLSPESFVFPAGTTYANITDANLTVTALKGSAATPVTITPLSITHSAGATELAKFTIEVVGSGTNTVSIKITPKAANNVSANGYFNIPCDLGDGIVITKRFSYSLAKTGTSGNPGISPNNVIVGMEGIAIPTSPEGLTLTSSTITIPWGAYQGTTRVAGTVTATTLPTGITVGTNTAATSSADGTLTLAVANGSSLGGATSGVITLTFTVNGNTFKRYFSWAKAVKGDAGVDGDDGLDAVVVAITSTNGTYFKTSTVVTTLKANIFKGGVQIPYANLASTFGTGAAVKWYKDGETTASSTGETVSINGTLVADKAVYEARLEV